MKKALLVLGAVAMVFSGVAAVSAYEAHTVNITAHVENAIALSTPTDWGGYYGSFGTVFPEEFLWKDLQVRVSTSFCWMPDQQRVKDIDYQIWVDRLPRAVGYYPWLGDALAFSIDGDSGLGDGEEWAWVGNAWPPPIMVTSGSLSKQDNVAPFYTDSTPPPLNWMDDGKDIIRVGLDVPVFIEYWNEVTDKALNDPKPSGKDVPTVVIDEGDPRYDPDGDDLITLGAKIIIQITNIHLAP